MRASDITLPASPHATVSGLPFTNVITAPELGRFSFDVAMAVHCRRWPHAASDFFQRASAWSDQLMNEIHQQGVDIVPKPSPGGNPHTEWRWSFSRVETTLFQQFSTEQKLIYMTVKMMFYTEEIAL